VYLFYTSRGEGSSEDVTDPPPFIVEDCRHGVMEFPVETEILEGQRGQNACICVFRGLQVCILVEYISVTRAASEIQEGKRKNCP